MLDFGHDKEEKNEKPVKSPKKRLVSVNKRHLPVVFAVIIICAISVVAIIFSRKDSASKLPQNIVSSLTFPAYYPASNPVGFKYVQGSAKITSGFLFYKFSSGSKAMSVTEGAAPSGINLNALPNHKDFQVSIGKAVLGTSLNNPSAVILTPTTLISITSTKSVTKDQVISLAQHLKQIENQGSY